MHYEVRDLGDGQFELVREERIVLDAVTAVLLLEVMTRRLAAIDAVEPARAADLPPAQPAADPVADPVPAPIAPDPETPLEEAFRRLGAGEALGAVADDIGIPIPRLRRLWAGHQEGASAAVSDCTACGRAVAASANGLCARCRRDVGGL